jgi:hypothetical protein
LYNSQPSLLCYLIYAGVKVGVAQRLPKGYGWLGYYLLAAMTGAVYPVYLAA